MPSPQHQPRGQGELAALRTSRGMTQVALAEAIGLTPQGYGEIEAGRNGTTVERMLAIAKALGVDPISVTVAITKDYQRPRGRRPRWARKSA